MIVASEYSNPPAHTFEGVQNHIGVIVHHTAGLGVREQDCQALSRWIAERSRTISFLLVLSLILTGCRNQEQPSIPNERVIISTMRNMVNSSLLYIAVQNGYFVQEGVEVTLQYQPTGKATIDDVWAGRADMGTGAQTPFLFSIMEGGKVTALASISETSENTAVIARRDRSIREPKDLKGKRIGIVSSTSSEFMLDTVLIANGLNLDDVTTVPLTPVDMPEALREGKVDAVSIWNFTLLDIRNELGDNGIQFSEKYLYTEFFLLVSQQEYTRAHPETIHKVMNALVKSADFIRDNPAAAKSIVASTAGIDIGQIEQVWGIYDFKPNLDHALVVALENGARWAMVHKIAPWKEIPDFSPNFYPDALKAVRPSAVTIIR